MKVKLVFIAQDLPLNVISLSLTGLNLTLCQAVAALRWHAGRILVMMGTTMTSGLSSEVGNLSQLPDRDSIPEQALFVKLQWCKLILHQNKTWEVRRSRTHKRGRFCLAASQTNMLLGEARLVDCIRIAVRSSVDNSLLPPPENPENFLLRKENWSKHLIADIGILADYGPAPGDKNDEPASKKPRLQSCKA